MAVDKEELLVFGYACTLFRDDGRALSQDAGDHLIPWMGDPGLRVDRYDGRGALHNLAAYEPVPSQSLSADPLEGLTDVEKAEEQMCQEERYRSLYVDDKEEDYREEEEAKRQDGDFNQVAFSYDTPAEQPQNEAEAAASAPQRQEDDNREFVAGPEMNIPAGMVVPPTVKLFSVIAKTAKFLANQGAQMEILLKAKQSGNQAFEFLSVDSELYPFYKHLVKLIKTKQYVPDLLDKQDGQKPAGDAQVVSRVLSLVPQYTPGFQANSAPTVPTVKYTRSKDCSYSQLISKIRSVAPPPKPAPLPPPPPPPVLSLPEEEDKEAAAEGGEAEEPMAVPPGQLQTIVDKMASYVSRNGRSFEEVVKSKDSERFSFLSPGDRHHKYYLHKLSVYTTGNYGTKPASEPVAFKVKKSNKDEAGGLAAMSALQYEDSTDSEQEAEADNRPNEADNRPKEDAAASNFPSLKGFLPPVQLVAQPQLYTPEEQSPEPERKPEPEEKAGKTDDNARLRDKLAAAAREKMVQVSRERALQLERKKKAAQFLAQLAEKKTMVSSVEPVEGLQDAQEQQVKQVQNQVKQVQNQAEQVEQKLTKQSSDDEELEDPDEDDEEGEEGELSELSEKVSPQLSSDEKVETVHTWPPPQPPQLVIPKLAVPPPPKIREQTPIELTSDSTDSEEPGRRRRHRSRSRSRHRRKRRRRRSSGSRSSRSSKKKKRKHKKSSSSRHKKSSRRRKRYSVSDSDDSGRSGSRTREASPDGARAAGSPPASREHTPIIDQHVKPALNKMTEDLRAKVRAMLDK